jgi:trk system potassium uptake protein TrkH
MFIGGSPAGTAGGVKTTTFATALAGMRAVLKGRGDVRLLDRRLDPNTVRRAMVLILLAGSLLIVCVAILMISGAGEPLALTFEAVSAFGTVGLSTGITSSLSSIQKLVIIVLMFIGRIGPLAFALSLSRPRTELVRLPETDILTG